MGDYGALAKELAHAVNLIGEDAAAESIARHLSAARADALEEAAARLGRVHFLFSIQAPGAGPFTRQDITMREVVEQGAAAIRALKP